MCTIDVYLRRTKSRHPLSDKNTCQKLALPSPYHGSVEI